MSNEYTFLEPSQIKDYVCGYQNGNNEFGKILAESFIPLIGKIVSDYTNQYTLSISRDDLFQEAVIGFYKSLKSFNPDKGNLSVYCTPYIRRELMDYIFNNKEMVRTITTKDMRKLYFNRHQYITDGKIDIDRMAESENVSRGKVIEFIEKMKFKPMSNHLTTEDESVIDSIECEWSDIDDVIETDDVQYKSNKLRKALVALSPRELEIIKRMYLDDDTISMSELARQQSVSPQRIKQIEVSAIKKLKDKI